MKKRRLGYHTGNRLNIVKPTSINERVREPPPVYIYHPNSRTLNPKPKAPIVAPFSPYQTQIPQPSTKGSLPVMLGPERSHGRWYTLVAHRAKERAQIASLIFWLLGETEHPQRGALFMDGRNSGKQQKKLVECTGA